MYEVGILGLDTTHADTLARVMWKYHDATVSAVWDGGAVRDRAYLEEFCRTYDATPYDQPGAMIEDVDAALVLTKNPATHRELATEFLEAGRPTLVDKPVAASVSDLEAMVRSSERGDATFFGGSAIPYHHDVQRLQSDVRDRTIHCVSYRGTLRYGHHVVDTVRKVIGADWLRVEPTPAPGETVAISFQNGSYATVRFDGPLADAGFGFLDIGDRVDTTVIRSFSTGQPNADEREREQVYRAYLDRFFANVEDRHDDAPWIVDASKLMLGALTALRHDRAIEPGDDLVDSLDLSTDISRMMERHMAHY